MTNPLDSATVLPSIVQQQAKLIDTQQLWIDIAVVLSISTFSAGCLMGAAQMLGFMSGGALALSVIGMVAFDATVVGYVFHLQRQIQELKKKEPGTLEMTVISDAL